MHRAEAAHRPELEWRFVRSTYGWKRRLLGLTKMLPGVFAMGLIDACPSGTEPADSIRIGIIALGLSLLTNGVFEVASGKRYSVGPTEFDSSK